MKIGIDVRMIESSGIGTSVRQVLDHRPKSFDSKIVLFGRPDWKNPYPLPFRPTTHPVYSLSQHWAYARELSRENLSLFYMPHYDVPWFYDGAFIATVHDLNHLLFPRQATKQLASIYARLVMGRTLRRAKKVLVDSKNTQRDLLDFFPGHEDRLRWVPLGVDEVFKPSKEAEKKDILKKYQLEKNYLLYVGNLRGTKNTTGLMEAYRQIRSRRADCPDLILVGKNSLTGAYGRGSFPAHVRHLGVVPAGDLPALYSAAQVFIFPTFYEGFGLPPLEAMACGTPVVSSATSSLPEVCGEAAHYVDPHSMPDMVDGISKVVFSSGRQEELRKKGFENVKRFSAPAYAEKFWTLLEKTLSETT